jgi:hypothetical protein
MPGSDACNMWFRRITEIYEVEPPKSTIPRPWNTAVHFGKTSFEGVAFGPKSIKRQLEDEVGEDSDYSCFKRIRIVSQAKRFKVPKSFTASAPARTFKAFCKDSKSAPHRFVTKLSGDIRENVQFLPKDKILREGGNFTSSTIRSKRFQPGEGIAKEIMPPSPLPMLYKPPNYSAFSYNPNVGTYDSAYGTSEVNSGAGELAQPISYLALLQPLMGRPAQQPVREWPNNGAKRRRLDCSGPSGVASLPPAPDTDVGVPPSGGLFDGDGFKCLEDWYIAGGRLDSTPGVIMSFVILYGLPEDNVREWFRNKRSLNPNEASRNGGSNSVMSTRQTGSLTYLP